MTPVAVFVKTPGLSPIKTRLAGSIGRLKAEQFYQVCCRWTEEVLIEAQNRVSMKPFWAVAETQGMKSEIWKTFDKIEQGEGNLGERLNCVYQKMQREFGKAIVLGADSPELSSDWIVSAVKEVEQASQPKFVLGKTLDGGFYLFGGNRSLSKTLWTSISYSENTTGEELKRAVAAEGEVVELPWGADVDWVQDLQLVMSRLKQNDYQKYSALLALQLI